MMISRERWLAVLRREKPDRVPMDIWATPEAFDRLREYLGLDTNEKVMERLHIDPPLHIGGEYNGPANPNGEGDIFGLRYRQVPYDGGVYTECVNAPLADYFTIEDIEANYTWPIPDWWSFTHLPDEIPQEPDRIVRGGGSEPLLTYKALRGQEQAFVDFLMFPEIVHYCLDKLFGLSYELTRRLFETLPGRVDVTVVAEDMGAQSTLMYPPDVIHTFLLPRMKKMMDLAHSADVYVFHHNDGSCRDILPDLIDAGIDMLNPIQWRCAGMEREGLKRDFGDRVIFHGGVDNQYTLPFGTVEEVRQEVEDDLRILGEGGGYILAPCHNIQAVSPPENIVAMYDAGYEMGR